MLENDKWKLVLEESVLSTLHRGGKGQNAFRMNFSNPYNQGCRLEVAPAFPKEKGTTTPLRNLITIHV